MTQRPFIERRKDYRLPYEERAIFTDGKKTLVGGALNLSKGGLFIKTLEPLPIDTKGHLAFLLPNHPVSLCVEGKIAHVVVDRQRAEVECGMGVQFGELEPSLRNLLNLYLINQQRSYLQLKAVLKEARPDYVSVNQITMHLPHLKEMDLAQMRYKVNRICTIFEESPLDEAKTG